MGVPGDDGREEEVVKGLLGNPNRDVELVGREQSEHGGDGPLHGVLGGGGDALPDDGRVEGLDAAEHVGQGRELVAAGPPQNCPLPLGSGLGRASPQVGV